MSNMKKAQTAGFRMSLDKANSIVQFLLENDATTPPPRNHVKCDKRIEAAMQFIVSSTTVARIWKMAQLNQQNPTCGEYMILSHQVADPNKYKYKYDEAAIAAATSTVTGATPTTITAKQLPPPMAVMFVVLPPPPVTQPLGQPAVVVAAVKQPLRLAAPLLQHQQQQDELPTRLLRMAAVPQSPPSKKNDCPTRTALAPSLHTTTTNRVPQFAEPEQSTTTPPAPPPPAPAPPLLHDHHHHHHHHQLPPPPSPLPMVVIVQQETTQPEKIKAAGEENNAKPPPQVTSAITTSQGLESQREEEEDYLKGTVVISLTERVKLGSRLATRGRGSLSSSSSSLPCKQQKVWPNNTVKVLRKKDPSTGPTQPSQQPLPEARHGEGRRTKKILCRRRRPRPPPLHATPSSQRSTITIHSRISILWTADNAYYPGTVQDIVHSNNNNNGDDDDDNGDDNNRDDLFLIRYDDNECAWVDLTRRKFKILQLGTKKNKRETLLTHYVPLLPCRTMSKQYQHF